MQFAGAVIQGSHPALPRDLEYRPQKAARHESASLMKHPLFTFQSEILEDGEWVPPPRLSQLWWGLFLPYSLLIGAVVVLALAGERHFQLGPPNGHGTTATALLHGACVVISTCSLLAALVGLGLAWRRLLDGYWPLFAVLLFIYIGLSARFSTGIALRSHADGAQIALQVVGAMPLLLGLEVLEAFSWQALGTALSKTGDQLRRTD
jgi:hypothetical protein